ncbi:MAG: fluoride efflux transporter CrcB [Microcoleus sp. SIO2G3]|nr:fluoride efflux transporter CrcB [Microcoleus sp. SIO2G3]
MLQDPLFRNPVAISLGAIAGALSRYYLTLGFAQAFGSNFPYGTFLINLSGCCAMGFFVTLTSERVMTIPPDVRLLVTTGFLGAYTTFSTYGLDSVVLFRRVLGDSFALRSFIVASLYWAGSAILGIISLQLGVILARLGRA